MASILIERKVFFSGIWKPSPRASQVALLKQISTQFLEKKSLSATYQLCTDGLRLVVVHDNGRKGQKSEKIPISAIQDICANRFNATCLMTVYVDAERRFNYLVCRCQSEDDAARIVLTFSDYKKNTVGEGYRIPIGKPQGTNWTLMPKENGVNGHSQMSSESSDLRRDGVVHAGSNGVQSTGTSTEVPVKIEVDTETFEREPCEIEGRPGFSVAVQTNFGETDSDRESMMSSTSYRSLKDELLTLSQEIRDIKFLLEKTTGISAEEYFKRDVNDNSVRHRTQVQLPEDGQDLPSPTDSTHSTDKHVNFAESADMPDYDIRQVGVQTERGQRKGYYVKRQGRTEGRTVHGVKGAARHRSSSSNSMQRSPASIGRAGGNDVFEFPPPSGRVLIRGSEMHGRSGYSSTIERPIEQVYNVYSRNFRNPRSKIVVLPPGTATMPAMRRPKSSSRSSVNELDNGH